MRTKLCEWLYRKAFEAGYQAAYRQVLNDLRMVFPEYFDQNGKVKR